MAPRKKAKKTAKKKIKKKKAKKKIALTLDDYFDLQEACQSVIGTGDEVVMTSEGAASEWKRLEPALQKLCTAINAVDRVAMDAARKEVRDAMGDHRLDMSRLDDGDDFIRELEELLSTI